MQVSDPQGLADIASVTLDGSALGRGEIALRDDGWINDGAPSDGVYGGVLTIAPGTPSGEQMLLVTAQDKAGHRASLQLGAFVVLAPVGGNIPLALPRDCQRTQTPVRQGGSVKDGIIVIQCSIVIPLIQKRGYTVKRTGG